MEFDKPAKTIDQQIELLRQRGMQVKDKGHAEQWLKTVGYYRLSGYWLPFEESPSGGQTRSKKFKPDTTFEAVVSMYVFDRRLRLMVSEAIERVEVALRSCWAHRAALKWGPHGYLNHRNFSCDQKYTEEMSRLKGRICKSQEVFIRHYKAKYSNPFLPPVWAVTETMTFTELFKWWDLSNCPSFKQEIAKDLGLPNKQILYGVLHHLCYTRNICAHHGRLWNRRIMKGIPHIRKFKEDMDIQVNSKRQHEVTKKIYNTIVILILMLRYQSPDTSFAERMKKLVQELDNREQTGMGFPRGWEGRPCWVGH